MSEHVDQQRTANVRRIDRMGPRLGLAFQQAQRIAAQRFPIEDDSRVLRDLTGEPVREF